MRFAASTPRIRCLRAALAAAALGATRRRPPAAPRHAPRRTTPSRIVPVDRIVAVVNDEVITQNDLNERVALVVRQLRSAGRAAARGRRARSARSSSA